jgi:hypothetical protein
MKKYNCRAASNSCLKETNRSKRNNDDYHDPHYDPG